MDDDRKNIEMLDRLMDRVRAGDEDAFEQLHPHLFCIVTKVVRTEFPKWAPYAADIAEDVCIKVWRRSATFQPGSAVLPWVFVITRNLCRDRFRHVERLAPTTPIDDRMPDPTPTPHVSAASNEIIAKALDQLSENQRRVILLVAEGYLPTEAASSLGIPVPTFNKRLHDARARLKSVLAQLGASLLRERQEKEVEICKPKTVKI